MRDELVRRLVHVLGAGIPLPYLFGPSFVTWPRVQLFFVVGLGVACALEGARLLGDLDWWIYDRLTREYEQDNLAGYFLYWVGMTVVAFAFEPTIAIPAMLMLAIADPVSGLLSAGELRPVKQTWVLLATFGVATLLAAPFVPPAAAILGGLAATIADGVKPVVRGYVIDDNITIPIAAGTVMFLAVEFLPRLPIVG